MNVKPSSLDVWAKRAETGHRGSERRQETTAALHEQCQLEFAVPEKSSHDRKDIRAFEVESASTALLLCCV